MKSLDSENSLPSLVKAIPLESTNFAVIFALPAVDALTLQLNPSSAGVISNPVPFTLH